ncbi:MAG: biotin--[acetyl-CoA-carboxylase] ligase [Actinomycetota bacterium]
MIERTAETNRDLARSRLVDSRFGTVDWLSETGSTNADLASIAASGAHEQVLVADHQTAGRGRLDRRWEAPPGAGLLVSVLVWPSVAPEQLPLLTVAGGWAMVGAARALGAEEVTLAWPNDVVVPAGDRYRKLAGVRSEAVNGPTGLGVVVGTGCNVDLPEGFSVVGGNEPVSLADLIGVAPDRLPLLAAYLRRLEELVVRLERGDGRRVLDEVAAEMWTLGRDVEVEGVRGRATALDAVGRLVLQTADGRHVVDAGDVLPR